MNEVGIAINELRSELADVAVEFMADSCSIFYISETDDERGGYGPSQALIAADVPCDYEVLRQPVDKAVGGEVITNLDHKLTLPSSPQAHLLDPRYRIVVDSRDDVGQLLFKSPVVLEDSLGPFVEVAAVLSQDNEVLPSGPFPETGVKDLELISGIVDIDWGRGSYYLATLDGDVTFTFSQPLIGERMLLELNTGAGDFVVTWPTVTWLSSGGVAPIVPTGADKVAVAAFSFDGTDYMGSYADNV